MKTSASTVLFLIRINVSFWLGLGLHEGMLCFNCEFTLIFLFRICCKVSHHITNRYVILFCRYFIAIILRKITKQKFSLYNLTLKTKNNMFRHSSVNKIHTLLVLIIKFKWLCPSLYVLYKKSEFIISICKMNGDVIRFVKTYTVRKF